MNSEEIMTREQYQLKMAETIIKNGRNLGLLIKKIAEDAISQTDIVQVDEENCRKLNLMKVLNFFSTEMEKEGASAAEISRVLAQIKSGSQISSTELDEGTLERIKDEAREIKTIRLREALSELESFIRLSHMFEGDGYHVSKFFEEFSDEPEKEGIYRGLIDDKARKLYRKKGPLILLSGIYTYLDAIKSKDINFLVDNLDKLIQNEEFTSRISIIFGTKDENGNLTTSYAQPEFVEKVWKGLHAIVRNMINFCHAKGVTVLRVKTIIKGKIVERSVTLDYERLAQEWSILQYYQYSD